MSVSAIRFFISIISWSFVFILLSRSSSL